MTTATTDDAPAAGDRDDAVLAAAVELARGGGRGARPAPPQVGEHLGAQSDGERLVTHDFACLDPAYRGWRWAVTRRPRVSRSKTVTVDEAVLLPGADVAAGPGVGAVERAAQAR